MSTNKDKERDYQRDIANAGLTRKNSSGAKERTERRKKSSLKTKITIRLDSEILDEFKELSPDGKGYQNLINQALKEWLSAQGVKELIREELTGLVAEAVGHIKENEQFVRG